MQQAKLCHGLSYMFGKACSERYYYEATQPAILYMESPL